ncbi:MAG TPA: isoaspartyl peptidase/L-asparaginase [Chitinophagaceae bacterium]|nr:isoaspartyl peptidase/L-asparaginase [Chitinophagaceae bacterium]HNM35267.1 isoaspartyl peptidase/L-asparaginase [Chitinophagaceae bacterium]
MQKLTLAIHGGAGTILKNDLTPELERLYNDGLKQALQSGYAVLEKNGTATDAVVAAVTSLENNILFNAGKGSVFTKNGEHEMDASIMEGKNLIAGAVAGVKNIKNPIQLAQKIMLHSNHVFLSGQGAFEFAQQQQLAVENEDYFYSEFRYKQWQAVKETDSYLLDHNSNETENLLKNKKFGTVGATACDAFGNLAAATSTGGMTNKQFNRIGDTPVIGGGTYANNNTCAISCTGHGELFIRAVAAYDVSCLMEYKNCSLQQAMDIVVNNKLVKIKGEGGMVGVDAKGNYAMLFNSEGMYRGVKNSDGIFEVAIYR